MSSITDKYKSAHQQSRKQPDPATWKKLERRLDQSRPVQRLQFTRMSIAASISVILLMTVAVLYLLQHNKPADLSASAATQTSPAAYSDESARMQHAPLINLPVGKYLSMDGDQAIEIQITAEAIKVNPANNANGLLMTYDHQSTDSTGKLFHFKNGNVSSMIRMDAQNQVYFKSGNEWVLLKHDTTH